MRHREEIREMMLGIKKQMEPHSGGPIRDTLCERLMALAWVLNYPEVPTLILSEEYIKLMECF